MELKINVNKIFEDIKPYLSLATLYLLTDLLYDYGLLKLTYPIGDILYYGRYVVIFGYYSINFCRKKKIVSKIRNRLPSNSFCSPKRNEKK